MEKATYNENIFITYANTPLKNNPDGLYTTLHQIKKYLPPLFPEIKEKIDTLVAINGLPFSKTFEALYEKGRKDFLKKMKEREQWIKEMERRRQFDRRMEIVNYSLGNLKLPKEEKIASALKKKAEIDSAMVMDVLQEIHGAKLMGCKNNRDENPLCCPWGELRNKIFKTKDLKCYECDHEHFVQILTDLIKGKSLSEIAGMKLLIHSYRMPQNILRINKMENSLYGEVIEKTSFKWAYGGMMSFPKIFFGAVTQSLIDFLLEGNQQKLKQCSICRKFFIAKHAKRGICSRSCLKIYMRIYLQKYMREKRNKAGPNFNPRYI